jgi:DNA-binding response OmpR family regulator
MTKGCVLVVDDSPDMREALRDLLSSEGYTPITAVDGLDGLEKLREVLPDLVVTDLMMPRMDGIAFMEAVARDRTYEGVPFILLTASDITMAKKRLRDAGLSCDLVHKPINLQDFLALVVGAVTRGHHARPESPEMHGARPPSANGARPRPARGQRPARTRPATAKG